VDLSDGGKANFILYKLNSGTSTISKTKVTNLEIQLSAGMNVVTLDFDIPNDGSYYALVEDNKLKAKYYSSSQALLNNEGIISDLQSKNASNENVTIYFIQSWEILYSIESKIKYIREDVKSTMSQLAQIETEKANKSDITPTHYLPRLPNDYTNYNVDDLIFI